MMSYDVFYPVCASLPGATLVMCSLVLFMFYLCCVLFVISISFQQMSLCYAARCYVNMCCNVLYCYNSSHYASTHTHASPPMEPNHLNITIHLNILLPCYNYVSQLPCVRYYVFAKSSFKHTREECESKRAYVF